MKISDWTKGVILIVFTITVFIIGAFIYRNTLERESEATFSGELTIEEPMPTTLNYSSDVVDKDTVFLAYSFDIYADKNWVTKGGVTISGSGEIAYEYTPDFIVTVTLNSTQDTIFYNNEIYIKQYIMKTIKDGKCPKCNTKMIIKDNIFYWRGTYFSGLVCEKCNALYDNPEDSFKKHIQQIK